MGVRAERVAGLWYVQVNGVTYVEKTLREAMIAAGVWT